MTELLSFICSCCGQVHEIPPSIGMIAPDPYLGLPEAYRSTARLEDDICYYEDERGLNHFVRVVLEIPIHGFEQGILWGLWVSLSQSSFNNYLETYHDSDVNSAYFGWVCNALPYYANTYALASDVHPQPDGLRPIIVLHESDHELYHDFKNGISPEKAQLIAELCIHPNRSMELQNT